MGARIGCFPIPRGLPRNSGGSASTSSLSRPAQASLTLRPARSLDRPRRPLSRGFGLTGRPTKPLVSYRSLPTTLRVEPSSTGVPRHRGAPNYPGLGRLNHNAPTLWSRQSANHPARPFALTTSRMTTATCSEATWWIMCPAPRTGYSWLEDTMLLRRLECRLKSAILSPSPAIIATGMVSRPYRPARFAACGTISAVSAALARIWDGRTESSSGKPLLKCCETGEGANIL